MTTPAVSGKRPSCFSIDSLISKTSSPSSEKREVTSQKQPHSPLAYHHRSPSSSPDVLTPSVTRPPVSRAAPVPPPASLGAPHPALLHGANTVYPGGLPPGFDPNHPLFACNPAMLHAHPMAFAGAAPRGFGAAHPPPMPGMHPAAAGAHGPLGPGKEGAPFYSWLLARHGNFLGQRFGGNTFDSYSTYINILKN